MPLPAEFEKKLNSFFPAGAVLTDPADCLTYGYDNSRKQYLPDGVIFATTHLQVVEVAKLCSQFNIPLITRGRGTNPVGATLPIHGGVILSLEKMNKIIEISAANRYMVVEPGVLNAQVQIEAAKHGLFWAPDPTSSAYSCIGGNLGCNAAGPRGVKYGTTRENVLSLTFITGEGKTIHSGVYTTKGVVGYDLARLMIGSEGTLGIITQAILKLSPIPEKIATMRALFTSNQSAVRAVANIMGQAVTPCAVEFADHHCVKIIKNNHPDWLPDTAKAMLMLEVDGPIAAMESNIQAIKQAASLPELVEFQVAQTKQEQDALWQARKSLSQSLRTLSPNKINEDIVVPVSEIAVLIDFLDEKSIEYDFRIVSFGHAGNGNLHVNLLVDPNHPIEGPKAKACLEQIFDKVIALKGTLSGEHGVGIEKKPYVHKELDETTIAFMKQIKGVFDPMNILNPGKIFP
jgi:D-lactate dehydrogenase